MDIFQNLNEEQRAAILATEGYVRVIAGAGTGKTRALTHRYAYLVKELGISTANILCVTFTNKAANEMKGRIRKMLGDYDLGYICTFHGFCVKLLREDIHAISYPQNFMIMDAEDTDTLLKTVYGKYNISARLYSLKQAKEDISLAKARGEHLPYFINLSCDELKSKCEAEGNIGQRVFLGYLYEQKKCFGLDFDDLITIALYILENYEECCQKWQKRMMYIMVDEFQDVSSRQYALADILSGYHKNLFVVGDPDQTIYSWRGADIRYILNFDKQHSGAKTIILNKNYRSAPEILNASNSLISKNSGRIHKELIAAKNSGGMPVVYNHAKTPKAEAEWITAQIQELIKSGCGYGDMAVLYRAHYVSRSIEEAFINKRIPYVLYSGVEFYKRREIKDVLSYLRMVLYADDLSFLRVINIPRRNIGKKRIAFIKDFSEQRGCSYYEALKQNLETSLFANTGAGRFVEIIQDYGAKAREMDISDILTGILNDSGYEAMLRKSGDEERLDNLSELKQSVFDFEKTSGEENSLEEYLQTVALYTNTDKATAKNSVKMMTIHSAKGLEFSNVFLCGLNEGIFPSAHTDTEEKLEEERRLAYVAYTRAQNRLFLTDAEGTNYDSSHRLPSRFIFDTDREYLRYTVELDESLISNFKRLVQEKEAADCGFKIGDRVSHRVFGNGEIIDIDRDAAAYVIKFDNIETTRNISVGLKNALALIDR